jgi:hypothetical protein
MAENPILTYLPLNGSLAGRDRLDDGLFTASGSGAVRWQPAENARLNLATNTKFQVSSTGWTAGRSGIDTGVLVTAMREASPLTLEDAPYCLSVEITANPAVNLDTHAMILNDPSSFMPKVLGVGDTYTLSGWVFTDDDNVEVGVELYEFTEDGTTLSVNTIAWVAIPVNQWTQVSASKTLVASGVGRVRCGFRFRPDSVGGLFKAYLTKVLFEEATSAGTYFDGSTSGASWFWPLTGQLGTADASPSCTRLALFTEEGTTNLCTNPSFEVDLTSWLNISSDTHERVTSHAYGGTAALHIVTSSDQSAGTRALFTASVATHTGSFRILGAAGDKVRVRFWDGLDTWGSQEFTLVGGEWELLSITAAITSGGPKGFYIDTGVTAQTVNWYIDCVQIEVKSYATTYCDGTIGTGYAWTGTAHASTSTRTVGSVYMPVSEAPLTLNGGFFVKAMRTHNKSWGRVFQGGEHSSGLNDVHYDITYTTNALAYYTPSFSTNYNGNWYSPSPSLDTEPLGNWQTNYMGFSETQVFTSIQDSTIQVASWPGTHNPRASALTGNITIGNDGSNSNNLNGAVSEFIVLSRPLTDEEYLAYYEAALAFEDLWLIHEQLLGSMVKLVGVDESPTLIKSSIDTIVFVE